MKLKFIPIIFTLLLVVVTIPAFAQSDDLVILQTRSGDLVIEFFPEDAPNHVENFITLTEMGFYDRTVFHRVIERFMIQGGDPFTRPGNYTDISQWGTGGPVFRNGTEMTIDQEFNDIKHNRGIVSMARTNEPNSAGSQFFIVHRNSNFLDGQYTVFGRLVTQESFETLDKIATLQTAPTDIPLQWGEGEILNATVVSRSQVPNLLELGEPERIEQKGVIPLPKEIDDSSGKFSSEELGFSATFPTGWLVQQPEKTQPGIPDVTAVAPTSTGLPSISVSIGESEEKTLEALVEERRTNIQPLIDSGDLEIESEERTKVNGHDAHVMIVKSDFTTSTGTVVVKFKETIIETPEKFYMVTYVNSEPNFENDVQAYDETIDTFKTTSDDQNPINGGGCLIATSTFGSELAPQVQQLRETRDNVLLKTESGKSFLTSFNQFYYSFSPTIADLERQNPLFKEIVKITITPLITSLSILNHVEINSESQMLGYGISLILLNIGMYFAAPAYIFYRLRK